jgi:hypothetical protein
VHRALQRQEHRHRPQGLALSTASVDQAKDEQQGRRTRRGHQPWRPLFIYISDGGEVADGVSIRKLICVGSG